MIETLGQKQPEGISKPSATERAISEFLECVKGISGVLAVMTLGGKNLADQSILVEVPDLRSTTADRVYMLHRDLFLTLYNLAVERACTSRGQKRIMNAMNDF